MNTVIMSGRLGRDPELRTIASGKQVCEFSIAVDRPGKKGEEKTADWFYITAWDALASLVDRYLTKGSKVLVTGMLRNSKYTDKSGNERTKTVVIAQNIEFLDTKRQTQAETYGVPEVPAQPAPAPSQPTDNWQAEMEAIDTGMIDSSDLPF
jgi:single-strand DNA-binding protein